MTVELCGTCQTFLGIDCTGGGLVVMGTDREFEWQDYSDWWRAGFPRLNPTRRTRVPVRPKLTLAEGPWPPAMPEIREVPHEWRTW